MYLEFGWLPWIHKIQDSLYKLIQSQHSSVNIHRKTVNKNQTTSSPLSQHGKRGGFDSAAPILILVI